MTVVGKNKSDANGIRVWKREVVTVKVRTRSWGGKKLKKKHFHVTSDKQNAGVGQHEVL